MLLNVWSDKEITYDEVWGGGKANRQMTKEDYQALKQALGED